jgi:hypothetical protein
LAPPVCYNRGRKMGSPVQERRQKRNMTQEHLARPCGLATGDVVRTQEGWAGPPAELQDHSTQEGGT